MKKIIALTLVALMAFSMIACDFGKDDETTETQTDAVTTEKSADTTPPTSEGSGTLTPATIPDGASVVESIKGMDKIALYSSIRSTVNSMTVYEIESYMSASGMSNRVTLRRGESSDGANALYVKTVSNMGSGDTTNEAWKIGDVAYLNENNVKSYLTGNSAANVSDDSMHPKNMPYFRMDDKFLADAVMYQHEGAYFFKIPISAAASAELGTGSEAFDIIMCLNSDAVITKFSITIAESSYVIQFSNINKSVTINPPADKTSYSGYGGSGSGSGSGLDTEVKPSTVPSTAKPVTSLNGATASDLYSNIATQLSSARTYKVYVVLSASGRVQQAQQYVGTTSNGSNAVYQKTITEVSGSSSFEEVWSFNGLAYKNNGSQKIKYTGTAANSVLEKIDFINMPYFKFDPSIFNGAELYENSGEYYCKLSLDAKQAQELQLSTEAMDIIIIYDNAGTFKKISMSNTQGNVIIQVEDINENVIVDPPADAGSYTEGSGSGSSNGNGNSNGNTSSGTGDKDQGTSSGSGESGRDPESSTNPGNESGNPVDPGINEEEARRQEAYAVYQTIFDYAVAMTSYEMDYRDNMEKFTYALDEKGNEFVATSENAYYCVDGIYYESGAVADEMSIAMTQLMYAREKMQMMFMCKDAFSMEECDSHGNESNYRVTFMMDGTYYEYYCDANKGVMRIHIVGSDSSMIFELMNINNTPLIVAPV